MVLNSAGKVEYTVFTSGDIVVDHSFEPGNGEIPDLPRFGMRMQIPDELSIVEWYGRGPHENGNRTDTRWIAFRDAGGNGLLVTGMPLLSWSALYYTLEDLTQPTRAKKHPYELQKQDRINVNLDLRQMGIGGDNSWGATPHKEYRLDANSYNYRYLLSPLDPGSEIVK